MSLSEIRKKQQAEQAAQAAQAEALRVQLDQFIARNDELHSQLISMSKEELVRSLMFDMLKQEEKDRRSRERLEQWVQENPEVAAKIRAAREADPAKINAAVAPGATPIAGSPTQRPAFKKWIAPPQNGLSI